MGRPDKITLIFVKNGLGIPELVKTELQTHEGGRKTAVAKEREEPGAFVWKIKGGKPRLFTLALVRAARLVAQEGDEAPREALLLKAARTSSITRKCIETELYDLTAYKSCVWLTSILSIGNDWTNDAKLRFSRWFWFHDVRGKDSSDRPSIGLNCENLPPENVEIVLDDHAAGPEEVDWIESVLSAHDMPEFPPYLIDDRHRTAGYMPSVGPAFGDRDEELRQLTGYYSE